MRRIYMATAVLLILLLSFSSGRGEQSDDLKIVEKLQDSLVKLLARVTPAFVNFGIGSGVCISEDGLVLTNNHVAGRSLKWTVRMPGGPVGKRFKAKVLWRDAYGDIALLKIDNKGQKLPFVPLGDSENLRVGQFVVALGTPFMTAREDSQPTVTFGIVSAVRRNMGNYSDCIMTDARVNPGNSGGPLIGMDGKLLGINGQIRVRFPYRVNTGIGLAVPVHQIKRFIEKFKGVEDGRFVAHGTIKGLHLRRDPKVLATVEKVDKGSAAEKAGFQPGDMVLSVDGCKIESYVRFWGVVNAYPEGWTIKVKVQRGAETIELKVTLQRNERTLPRRRPSTNAYMGVRLAQAPVKGGCKIDEVIKGGPADKAGLKDGDIIIEADGKKIDGPDALRRILAKKKPGDVLKLKILRGDKKKDIELRLGRRPRR